MVCLSGPASYQNLSIVGGVGSGAPWVGLSLCSWHPRGYLSHSPVFLTAVRHQVGVPLSLSRSKKK